MNTNRDLDMGSVHADAARMMEQQEADEAVVTSQDMQDALVDLLRDAEDAGVAPWLEDAQIQTYADGGYLTRDAGMVVQLHNGERFQITICRY
jgi:hypothetical protein